MSILLDIAALLLVVICSVIYARKGLLSGIVVLLGTAAAIILATAVADQLSPAVFENFFRSSLEQRTVEAISQQSVANIDELLRSVLGFLPENTISAIVEGITANLDFSAGDIAHQIVEQVIAPLVIPIISVVVFFVVFAVVKVVVRLLASALTGMNKMPVLGGVNQALGAVMGLLIGLLYVFLLLCIIWAVGAAYGGTLVEETFSTSILYNVTSGLNIFS